MIQLSLRKRSFVSCHKMNVICLPYDNVTALSSQPSKNKGRKRKRGKGQRAGGWGKMLHCRKKDLNHLTSVKTDSLECTSCSRSIQCKRTLFLLLLQA